MPEPSVLVVDDDPVIRRLLELAFELEGFQVFTANDGVEGLDAARSHHPSVIVLDIMMPRMDGLKVTGELKADDATKAIPVLLLSAKANSRDIAIGMKVGADDYVTKPCDPNELVSRARALLERAAEA